MTAPAGRAVPRLLPALLAAALLAGCGAYQPGRPGAEPPSAGRFNPASGETNASPQ